MLTRLIWATLFTGAAALAQQDATNPENALVRDVFRELIETNTTHSTGSTGVAAEKMAARLKAAGFPAADISGVRIFNSTFHQIKKPDQVVNADVKLVDCVLDQAGK